ncbi:MAG: hypothetical protein CMB99_11600 [Flavobacteriaceae bacterium]|nr:hypothetical protein [Flavobacteriaceae bacterium]|tara:strand:- start:240984 stop:244295 length:3312 start_codon:yes stop_codon:yes gene_type:complete
MKTKEHKSIKIKKRQQTNLGEHRIRPIGFFEHDFKQNTLWWSDSVFEILGFPKADHPPRFEEFIERVHKSDANTLIALVERAEKYGEDYNLTYRYQIPEQPIRHILVYAKVLFDSKKKPKGLKGSVQDITKEVIYENLINDQKEELELQAKQIASQFEDYKREHEHGMLNFMDSIPGFAFIKDKNLNYLHANKAFCDLLNISTNEIEGKTDYDIFPKDLAKKYRSDDQKVLKSGKELTVEESTIDASKPGKRFVVATRKIPWFDNQGNLKGLYGLGFDISELKLFEQTKEARDKALKVSKELKKKNEDYEVVNEELRLANKELQEAFDREKHLLERLSLVMEVTSDGVFDWDLLTNGVYFSPRWKSILGYQDHELINEFSTWEKLTKEEDIPKTMEKVELITTGKADNFEIEFQMQHKDGYWVDILSRAKIFYNKDEKAYRIVGTHTDITEKKKIERVIQEANITLGENLKREEHIKERLEQVLSATTDGIFDTDLINQKVYYSPRWKEMLGYSDAELPNDLSIWNQLTDDEDAAKTLHAFEQAVSKKTKRFEVEFSMIHKDGRLIDILSRSKVFYNEDGIPYRLVGTHTDITEKNESIRQFERLFNEINLLYANDPNLIIVKDTKNNIIRASESVSEMLGMPKHLIEGKPARLVYPEMAEIYYKDDLEVIKTKKPKKGIIEKLPTADGELKWLQTDKIPVFDDDNEVKGIILFATDITELKIAQQRAEESSQLKTEFLNNLSHEVRTPMNGILGFSNLLSNRNLTDEKRDYFVKIIQNSSKQLLQILNDILEISTLETKQVEIKESEFNINEVLMEIFSIFNLKVKEKQLALYVKKSLPDNACNIITDKSKLIKILSNLVENAIKYTNEGFVEFGYNILNELIIFYVKDTGIGIAKENFEMIFERFSQEDKFYSQKTGGLGLGLSISKEHATLLNGYITLESEKGKGSTFYLSIPHKSKIDLSKKIPTNEYSADGSFNILIAEDEDVNYLYLEALFEEEMDGTYNLFHAKNGKEAVDICENNNNINLVLMDIKMPVMGGYEATNLIKEKKPDLPIIFQTAYSLSTDIQDAFDHGCDDFIAKPINKADFFRVVYKYLKKDAKN